MKQSIKIASLVLAMVMTLAMLTACSGGGGNTGGNTGGSAGGGSSAGSGTGGSGDNKGDNPGGGSSGGSSGDDDKKDESSILWKNSLLSEVYSGNNNIIQKKFAGTDSRTRTAFKAMYGFEGSDFVTYLSGNNGTYIMSAKDILYDDNTDFEFWRVNEDGKENNKYTVVKEVPEGYDLLYILCDGPKQKSNPTVTTQWETYKNTKYYTEHAVILDSDAGVIDCVYFYPTNTRADVKLVKLRQGSGNWVYLENMDVREGTVEISNTTSQNIFDREERRLMNLENYEPEENGGTGGDKPGVTEKEVPWANSRLGSIYSMADRSNVKFYGTNSSTGKQEIFLGGYNNSLNKTVAYWDVDAGRYLSNRNKEAGEAVDIWKINAQNQYITKEDNASEFTNIGQINDLMRVAAGPHKEDNSTVVQSRETYNGVEYYTEKARVSYDGVEYTDCTYYYTSDTASNLSDIQMIKVEAANQKTYYLTDLTIKMSSTPIDATIGNIFTAQERKWLDPSNYTHVGGSSTGGDKEEDEKETTIPWSQSRTSKVYYMDEPRNNGAMSVKFCATDASTGKRGVYAWVSNPDIKKIILYYSDPDGTMLWQVDMKTREDEFWEIEGDTYTVWDGNDSGPFGGYAGEAEIIADGPESAKNPTVVSAMRTYRNQEYYTETAYITAYRGKTFKCTYYYPKTASAGKSLNDIQIIRVDVSNGRTVYLTDVDARISNEYVNSEKSIFTKKQQEALDPRNYTEAKE